LPAGARTPVDGILFYGGNGVVHPPLVAQPVLESTQRLHLVYVPLYKAAKMAASIGTRRR
jgi:hypothetical protein